MPWLDVSDLTFDPDIAGETIVVTHRTQTTNANGVAVISTSQVNAIASVVPLGANSLVRDEAYTAQSKGIRVITSTRLQGASSAGAQPDLILWRGSTFIVKTVDDYSAYGAGLVVAECVLYDLNPAPVQ